MQITGNRKLKTENPDNLRANLSRNARRLAARPSLQVVQDLAAVRQVQVYLVGGTVRDLALERQAPDLDLAVSAHSLALAREVAAALGGTFVLLDEGEGSARVVRGEEILDLAEFRAPSLEQDLKARDFTINAMALDLHAVLAGQPGELVDPCGGLADLAARRVRMIAASNFQEDPLRLLRAYRFAATLGFTVSPETAAAIERQAPALARVAGERLHQELMPMLSSPRSAPLLAEMHRMGLLTQVLPELADMEGVDQNGYHHLDVLQHSLLTVAQLEDVLAAPPRFFGTLAAEVACYAAVYPKAALLKLAALFHDVGKPQVQERRTSPDRYTFYHHERVGLEIFARAAQRLRFSQAEAKTVSLLIKHHMRPFLLLPVFRQGKITLRALGRLVRAVRPEFPGFFALAMADSLAGQGPAKPPDVEAVLADLAEAAYRFLKDRLEPQEQRPRLLSGHDLIKVLRLSPGPQFRRLLTAVEEAQWEGEVTTREEALELVRRLL